jgi:DNA (cytosine-5)-methyltransferase 1
MNAKMTVADFFCGAGGFSEGFRMAGFDVVFAVDNWRPAQLTHKINHPDCKHPGFDYIQETDGDIMEISPFQVPDTDVIVGSPPCVSFSSSNKAGKADKSTGIELIEKFLQIVAVKKHKRGSKLKYWVMENVPNSEAYTKGKYTFRMLGIDDKMLKEFGIKRNPKDVALKIEKKDRLFNAVDYGVPQSRTRFICGDFPIPEKTTPKESNQITLMDVVKSLSKRKGFTVDPVYGFKINTDDITDHFYDTTIPKQTWEDSKWKKQNARFYGVMSFPENQDRPSRTVTATMTSSSRESMIFQGKTKSTFRSPTIREIASLMSFPINYLFQANTDSSKYRLVGNAICPSLSYAIACAISLKLDIVPVKEFKMTKDKERLAKDLRLQPPAPKKVRDRHDKANFAEIVPGVKHGNFRVELDNNSPRKGNEMKWKMTIHHATGINNMKVMKEIPHSPMSIILRKSLRDGPSRNLFGFIDCFASLEKELPGLIKKIPPNPEIFQQQHCHEKKSEMYISPRSSLEQTQKLADKYFPNEKWKKVTVPVDHLHRKLSKINKKFPPIPLRIIVVAYIVALITEKVNKDFRTGQE